MDNETVPTSPDSLTPHTLVRRGCIIVPSTSELPVSLMGVLSCPNIKNSLLPSALGFQTLTTPEPWAFGHIFAGGYAAGYYSYLWAEVLSADAFSAFEDSGIFDKKMGARFLTKVLAVGGSVEAVEMFKAFRGCEPQIDALLRHSGLK